MATKLDRRTYELLIEEDLAWLAAQPRTLERDHIIEIVKASPRHEYETTGPSEAPWPPP